MGISPIEYKSWTSDRTPFYMRPLEMMKKIWNDKVRSKGVLVILIIGLLLVHLQQFIFAVFFPPEELTAQRMIGGGQLGGSYLNGMLFFLIAIILAAVVSSGLISRDMRDNSLVLYFSRPIRPVDYILGKWGGALGIMLIFTLLPPLLYGLVVIGLQSSSNYMASIEVLFYTLIAGLFSSVIFLSYSLFLSSLTKRKAYSGIGTFMSFLVLTIVSEIFVSFDKNWSLLSPYNLLRYSNRLIFREGLPDNVDAGLYSLAICILVLLPMILLFYRIYRKEVGK